VEWKTNFYDGTKNNEHDALGGLIQNSSEFSGHARVLLVTEGAPIRVEHRNSGHFVSRTELLGGWSI